MTFPRPRVPATTRLSAQVAISCQEVEMKWSYLEQDPLWKTLDVRVRQCLENDDYIQNQKYPQTQQRELRAVQTRFRASTGARIDDGVIALFANAFDMQIQQRLETMQPKPRLPATEPVSRQRPILSTEAKRVLRTWFDEHFHHPYPSEQEKRWLSAQAGIRLEQVNNWFINTRVRAWKPKVKAILDADAAGNSAELDAVAARMQAPYQIM